MIGDRITTTTRNPNPPMPSPNLTGEVRPHSIPQDNAGGLGYNRGLIGAAQALHFDSAPANRHQGRAQLRNRLCGSGGPSPVMATGTRRSVRMSRSKFVPLAMLMVAVLMLGTAP